MQEVRGSIPLGSTISSPGWAPAPSIRSCRVMLPIIAPGVVAGAFLAFIASLDVRVEVISELLILPVLVLMIVLDRFVGLARRMSS